MKRTEPGESPAKVLGEKLFRDPRFSFHFAKDSKGDVNAVWNSLPGDPILTEITRVDGTRVRSPFKGQYYSCASCHLVGQARAIDGLGSRAYSDFAKRSPVPQREDGQTQTLRNAQPMVNIMKFRQNGLLLHYDGEFVTGEDLVMGSITGRNFGWLPGEQERAKAQIVKVLREDSGKDPLGEEFGGSYSALFGENSQLPKSLRVDVKIATDQEILAGFAKIMTVYMNDLLFFGDDDDLYTGSPYDQFLILNGLPRAPAQGESDLDYSLRLAKQVSALQSPKWFQGQFRFHNVPAKFGADEMKGFLTFMAFKGGHCVGCHAAPHFSDFQFRTTGISQLEYDSVQGDGTFLRIELPSFQVRNSLKASDFVQWRSIPNRSQPNLVDLGAWGVLGNPGFPKSQAPLNVSLCPTKDCSGEEVLHRSLAAFKTPTLRDLGQSAPYFHNGVASTLEQAVQFYQTAGNLMRTSRLRNGDNRLRSITLTDDDVKSVALFLQSLNEDYDD